MYTCMCACVSECVCMCERVSACACATDGNVEEGVYTHVFCKTKVTYMYTIVHTIYIHVCASLHVIHKNNEILEQSYLLSRQIYSSTYTCMNVQ